MINWSKGNIYLLGPICPHVNDFSEVRGPLSPPPGVLLKGSFKRQSALSKNTAESCKSGKSLGNLSMASEEARVQQKSFSAF